MFTTGSKLFLGASVLSIVAAVVVGVTTGGAAGWTGTISLIGVAVAFCFLAGVNFAIRDGNVPSMQEGAAQRCAAAQPPVGRSFWPAIAAVGVGLLAVGAETMPIVFKAGIVVVLAAGVEWMVQSWSERASADPAYNAELRKRVLHPLEFPVLAAVGLGVVIYSFSRIMLWIDKAQGPVAFGMIGALILAAGFIIALRPGIKRSVIAGVSTVAALGLVSTGAVMAIDGQREITHYPTTRAYAGEVCEAPGEIDDEHLREVDERASQTVAAKSAVAATVVIDEDGELLVYPQSADGRGVKTLSVVRSNPTNLLFRNLSKEPRRFTVNLGTFTTDVNGTAVKDEPKLCTNLVDEGKQTLLTVKFVKPSFATEEPFSIVVPGTDQEIEVVVP